MCYNHNTKIVVVTNIISVLKSFDPSFVKIRTKFSSTLLDFQFAYKTICEIYGKKMDKIMSYRQKGFEKIGLIIIYSDSLIPVKKETMEENMKYISEKFKEKYDFVFLVASETFFEFDDYGNLIGCKRIEEMDLLKKCARLLAEQKIGIESIEKEL